MLTKDAKDKILALKDDYIKILENSEVQDMIVDRNKRVGEIQSVLGKNYINNFDDIGLLKIISLFSFNWFTRKDYIVKRLIEDNGIKKLLNI